MDSDSKPFLESAEGRDGKGIVVWRLKTGLGRVRQRWAERKIGGFRQAVAPPLQMTLTLLIETRFPYNQTSTFLRHNLLKSSCARAFCFEQNVPLSRTFISIFARVCSCSSIFVRGDEPLHYSSGVASALHKPPSPLASVSPSSRPESPAQRKCLTKCVTKGVTKCVTKGSEGRDEGRDKVRDEGRCEGRD